MLASKPLAKFCPTAYSTPTGMCHWHLKLITSGSEHSITVPPASPHLEMASSVFCAKPQELFLSLLISTPSHMWSQILLIASSRHLLLLSAFHHVWLFSQLVFPSISSCPLLVHSPLKSHSCLPSTNLIWPCPSCARWWLLVFPDFPTSRCLTSALAPIVSSACGRLSSFSTLLGSPKLFR